ncbi:MAG: hypothetical protein Q9164_005693 [Protoblastenia rupestris]
MDRSIAQALHGLIPALSGPLPPELLELSSSLLAQSRSKASSLKADEEIARSYACANIACERLKQSLSLPKIEPRPPCPPRVYQNLYKYLDGALPVGIKRGARVSRGGEQASLQGSMPIKSRTPVKPTYTTPTRRKAVQSYGAKVDVPVWVMPVIRRLCKKLEAPAAPHHIYAGVSSIFAARSQDDGSMDQLGLIKIPALIIVVFFLVATRLAGIATPSKRYVYQRELALTMMKELAAQDVELEEVDNADVDALMRQVGARKWTEMDWFGNIQLGSGTDIEEDEANIVDEGPLIPGTRRKIRILEESEPEYLQPGLGTMMQDKVDYLSDERRRDYLEWKTDILLRIQELEKEQESTMDVDLG